MYDFANSGYTTVVITAVFNAYFVGVVCAGDELGHVRVDAGAVASYALIIVTAPIRRRLRRRARGEEAAARDHDVRAACSAPRCLSLVGPGRLALAFALIVLSNFFFGTGENIVAAFLPELAQGRGDRQGLGWGWSLGYIGGLVALARVPRLRDLGQKPGRQRRRSSCRSRC